MITEIKSLFFPVCAIMFLTAFLGLSVAQAQEENAQERPPMIDRLTNRENLLELSEQLLDSGDPTFYDRVSGISSPYLVYVEKRKQVRDTGVEKVVLTSEAGELPDYAILKIVADRLNPKGSLIMGGKHVLLLEKAGKITVGSTIPITIRNNTYKVIVTNISVENYTIKLNETERIVSLRAKPSRGKIALDKP